MATSKLGRLFGRTETVNHNENRSIHAEKNQDIEVENDETHVLIAPRAAAGRWDDADIVHVVGDDGPSTLLAASHSGGGLHTMTPGYVGGIVGDWDGDGRDTVGFSGGAGDADADGDIDGTDFL